MQKDSHFFDDLAKLATGAAGSVLEMRHEVEAAFNAQAEKLMRKMNVVTREEFDAVRLLAAKAVDENESLKKRIEALEKK